MTIKTHAGLPASALAALLLASPALAQPVSTPIVGSPSTIMGASPSRGPHDLARTPGGTSVSDPNAHGGPAAGQPQVTDGPKQPADPFRWTDWIQAVTNVLLFGANVALWFVTNRSAKAAQASAQAALRQAEIMGAAEAPVVRVTNVRIGGQGLTRRDGRPQIPDQPFLIVDLVNRGRSSASITAFGLAKVVQRNAPTEVAEAEARDVVTDIFLLPQGSYQLAEPFDLSGGERHKMMQAVDRLWIWGFVDFQDGLGKVWRQRFFVQTMIDANQNDTLFFFRDLKPPRLTG